MSTQALRLELELDRVDDPIEGRVRDQHGKTVHFSGWLDLITALDAIRAGARIDTPNDAAPSA